MFPETWKKTGPCSICGCCTMLVCLELLLGMEGQTVGICEDCAAEILEQHEKGN